MSDTHALLIGIDAYLENRLPNGGFYPQLGGCVRDVTRVEEYLRTSLGLAAERIVKLTASLPDVIPAATRGPAAWPQPVEPPERLPTYENMVAAFRKITETAQPGDEVFIHYSGHGGRAATVFPEKKGADGLDEALVPVDIGNGEVRYLRDIELSHLLRTMVDDRKLRVTVVLDCCHSGGAVRDHVMPRGPRFPSNVWDKTDRTVRPKDSLVASREELLASWGPGVEEETKSGNSRVTRDVQASTRWLPSVKGFVMLAACREQESAYECDFGAERSGALTHWMLDAVRQRRPGLTYRDLLERVVAKVHGDFLLQTPMLLGEGDWEVFGAGSGDETCAVDVLKVEADGRVLLNTGQAQGIRDGARFALYPLGASFAKPEMRSAVVEVKGFGATESWAEAVEEPKAPLEPGAQAVLLDLGADRFKSSVRLLRRDAAAGGAEAQSLDQLGSLIAVEKGFLRLSGEDDSQSPADFQVAIAKGEIEIQDGTGQPLQRLGPGLSIDDSTAAQAAVRRLVHLAKSSWVRQIENFSSNSPLAGKLHVDLLGVQADYDPADRPSPRPGTAASDHLDLVVGEWTFLRIENRFSRVLNITVFDFQPDWGLTQVHPGEGEGAFFPLDPNKVFILPLQGHLPEGFDSGTDLLKVFAALGTIDYHWLELPALDPRPSRESGPARGGTSESQARSFSRPASTQASRGGLIPSAFPSEEWVTAQVEVKIRRK